MKKYFLNLTNAKGELKSRLEIAIPETEKEFNESCEDYEIESIFTRGDLRRAHFMSPSLEASIIREIALDLGEIS
jgi:hypothetical protein